MSLFDHIKKKPDANEEPKKNEPVANDNPGSADLVDLDNDIAGAESENQEFENMNDENTSESAPFSETSEKETAPVVGRRFSVGIDLGTTHCV